MRPTTSFPKRVIGGIYSAAADRLYEPVVVRRMFPLLGGDLNERVVEQGRRAVEVAHGRPILDMPIGTAFFTVQVAHGHDGIVVGADIAEGMVRAARQKALLTRNDNVVTVQADAHHLPFEDGSFGAILCTNGLQVIPGLHRTLLELARVLHETGRLFVSVVTLPLGRGLPRRGAARLPTVLKSRREIEAAFERASLRVRAVAHHRLALLLEATL